MTEDLPEISVVVIGLNEADNLDKTFSAIKQMNYPAGKIELIYVDSGSVDESVDIARKYAGKVCIENKFPSPGRNRNRGLVEAAHEIVHFIDGDVIIHPDYLRNIVPLFGQKDVQAILGKLEERSPNLFNKMAMYSNSENREGYAEFTATGATYLKSALMAVDGYDERIRRGQETELGQRFRDAGYKIWRTKHKMGDHNFGIRSLSGFLRIYYLNGKSLCQVSLLPDNGKFFRQTRATIFNQHIKFIFYIFLLAYTITSENVYPLIMSLIFLLIVQNRSVIRRFSYVNWHYNTFKIFLGFIGQFYFYFGVIREYFNYLNKSSTGFYKLEKMKLSDSLSDQG